MDQVCEISAKTPPGPEHKLNPFNHYSHVHANAPPMDQGFSIPSQFLNEPLVANVAMQYGQALVGSGKQLVDRELEKYVPVSRLKYYFAVDTGYVTRKLGLLFFPFTHSDWSVKYEQDEPVQPRYEINAPDLYIPTMAYVTYVLVAGLVLGMQDRTVSSQFTVRLPWLILLAQSLEFTVSRTPDLQRQSTDLRTQVLQLRSTALELRASDAHTAADTLKSNSGLEAGFTATQDWLACCPTRQIAAECHIGLATVNSIIKRYRETGSITPQKKGNCGRKRKTSPADDRLIVRKSKLNPRLTAVNLTRDLMATLGRIFMSQQCGVGFWKLDEGLDIGRVKINVEGYSEKIELLRQEIEQMKRKIKQYEISLRKSTMLFFGVEEKGCQFTIETTEAVRKVCYEIFKLENKHIMSVEARQNQEMKKKNEEKEMLSTIIHKKKTDKSSLSAISVRKSSDTSKNSSDSRCELSTFGGMKVSVEMGCKNVFINARDEMWRCEEKEKEGEFI
ncbi:hypothetical protein ANN_19224 [Periplaneta americana]|uniref:Homeodomain-like DNA binding domain-containing transcription factor n=1 Tax=Periplaneta americana TaxID=6978 RepID=A0ABQ8SA80_PERAM|nr:hypothetical protein ANN_19224 [Periplaneta americana]